MVRPEDKLRFPSIPRITLVHSIDLPVHKALPSAELALKSSVMALPGDQSAAWRKTSANVLLGHLIQIGEAKLTAYHRLIINLNQLSQSTPPKISCTAINQCHSNNNSSSPLRHHSRALSSVKEVQGRNFIEFKNYEML